MIAAGATRAYVALGSNLDDPLDQVRRAATSLGLLDDSTLVAVSGWYRSEALGPGPQPDYINGVAAIDTRLAPHRLLAALQRIERDHHRQRTLRWGPRTLDLDILLYGDLCLATGDLTIPHPRMAQRNFVLQPLAELAPALVLPDGTALADLLANVSTRGIVRLADT